MKYQLINDKQIKLITDDGGFIWVPIDDSNGQYHTYLDWLAAGNTPLPADPQPVIGG